MPKRSLPPLPEWYPRGTALLRDPTLNKGTAFSDHERDVLGLRGLLPPHVATQDEQVARVLENFHRLRRRYPSTSCCRACSTAMKRYSSAW